MGFELQRGLFPAGLAFSQGRLVFEGVVLEALAKEHGTPLMVLSETAIRARCREVREHFLARYPGSHAYYASKAFQTLDMIRIITEEGLGLDVVSGGELYAALKAGCAPSRIMFHGNAKTDEELEAAVRAGVGRIVVDNIEEILRIEHIAASHGTRMSILLRVTPGVDSHTHRFISTGSLDSKFGIPLEASVAPLLAEALRKSPHVECRGLHFHVGSQLTDNRSHLAALGIVLDFASRLRRECDIGLQELNMGGGFGIRYLPHDPDPGLAAFVEPMMAMVHEWSKREHVPMPLCAIEPGRWIVGEAGLTIYRVVNVKEIPGIRTYVAVDGGMGDNIRPALYEARYHVVPLNAASGSTARCVTIAGRYCESGDILVRDCMLPDPKPGDLLALLSTGAYCHAMASTYNRVPRPAVVMVSEGRARLSVRRETFDDLLAREL